MCVSSVDATDAEGDRKKQDNCEHNKRQGNRPTTNRRTESVERKSETEREEKANVQEDRQREAEAETETDTERKRQGPPEAEMSYTENWLHIERRRST